MTTHKRRKQGMEPAVPVSALCRILVQTSVPLRILALQDRGGITPDELARVAAFGDELAGEQSGFLLVRSPPLA